MRLEPLSNDNTLKGNRITNNRGSGAELDTVLGTQVLGNLVTGNDTYRISLYVASASLLKGNTVEGSSEAGISVSASSDNLFKKDGSSANSEAGFSILSGTGNVLLGNVANENLSEGIVSAVSELTLVGNGFLDGVADGLGAGIEVPAGTTNSKNRAARNDAPYQWLESDVNCFVP